MAVYTKNLRHLNARWIIDLTKSNKLYCGVSKNVVNLSSEYSDVSMALNNCNIFSKVYSSFVREGTDSDYDARFLTKQIYGENIYTEKHTFLDNVCYWKFINEQDALYESVYNTDTYFILTNTDLTKDNEFKNLKSFYFFYNFKINNETPSDEQIIRNENDSYTAEDVVVLERVSISPDGNTGRCIDILNGVSIPYNYKHRFNYFISF